MTKRLLILLSGPIGVGKTSVRSALVARHSFDYVRSGQYLVDLARRRAILPHRRALQDLGDELDALTDFKWVVDEVALPGIAQQPDRQRWLVDAVRKDRQVLHFREEFPELRHIHLCASEDVLRARYNSRQFALGEDRDNVTYDEAIRHMNEVASRGLAVIADGVIDTSNADPNEIADHIVALVCA